MNRTEGLSAEEKSAVEELHERVKNYLNPKLMEDPSLYRRFLKARDFNVNDAESMLRKHQEWRDAYRIDYILTEYKVPEVIDKYFNPSIVGFDKDGCLIRYLPVGKMDMRGIFRSTTVDDVLKGLAVMMEDDVKRAEEQNKKSKSTPVQFLHIYDLDQFSVTEMTNRNMIELMLKIISLTQDNYPERMKGVFVINAPSFFPVLFSIFKAIMANALLSKIQVFSRDGWKDALVNAVDVDVLPAFLGGQKTDSDGNPLCKSFIFHGGQIPEEYYVVNCSKRFSMRNDVQKLYVPTMSKNCVTVDIPESGSTVEWEFAMKAGDIGFGLLYRRNGGEMSDKELLTLTRVNTDTAVEQGLYHCERKGIYTFVFDNSHSWLRGKEVYYKVTVTGPAGGKCPVI